VKASDAFDLALKGALPKRAPSEPSAPATFHRAFPYTPEPVDSQPPSQDGPVLISRDSICPAATLCVCICQKDRNTTAPSPCFCTSPPILLLPLLSPRSVWPASWSRQPTPSGPRRTGCQRTHLRPPSPQQQVCHWPWTGLCLTGCSDLHYYASQRSPSAPSSLISHLA
jgi:hypothetical protein